jgi:hypothetical protein
MLDYEWERGGKGALPHARIVIKSIRIKSVNGIAVPGHLARSSLLGFSSLP